MKSIYFKIFGLIFTVSDKMRNKMGKLPFLLQEYAALYSISVQLDRILMEKMSFLMDNEVNCCQL